MLKILILATFCIVISTKSEELLPILLWHSAGESCCDAEFQTYSSVLKKYLGENIFIKSAQIGESAAWDRVKSLTVHPFEQIAQICDELKTDEKFINGYNAIGLSQGALLLRGLAQTCPYPKMRNLISLGGPQNGVFQYPKCGKISSHMCALIRHQLSFLVYAKPSQNFLTPATYWHDLSEQRYQKCSTFLAILNNVREINVDYVNNLQSLNKLVLVKYENDQSVIPNESTFFGYWDINQTPINLEDSRMYQEDRLGLKLMNDKGQLVFLTCPDSAHLEMIEPWFYENVIPYFM